LNDQNKKINGLWIGKTLSCIELLCLKSFIAHGHEFHLWVYENIETPLPEGVIVENARNIIPEENVFCYKNSNQYGHGKGSYAGFSDIFRYKLLYEHGGWWVDMDVVCLKHFDFETPYVFRTHDAFKVVGNIMKCEEKSEVMRLCYEKAMKKVDANNRDWNLPIRILNETIDELQFKRYIVNISNADSWLFIIKSLLFNFTIPEKWYALHLINEEWRRNHINKKAISGNSCIGKLLEGYGLLEPSTFGQRAANTIRIIVFRFAIKRVIGFIRKKMGKMEG